MDFDKVAARAMANNYWFNVIGVMVRVNEDVAPDTTITNTVGFTNTQSLSGAQITPGGDSGIPGPTNNVIQVAAPRSGPFGRKWGGRDVKRVGQTIQWSITATNPAGGDFTIVDTPRPQLCLDWVDSDISKQPSNECTVAGGDNVNHFVIDAVRVNLMELATGNGYLATKVVFVGENGERDEHDVAAQGDVAGGSLGKTFIELTPRIKNIKQVEWLYKDTPTYANISTTLVGRYALPSELFNNPDLTLGRIEVRNDVDLIDKNNSKTSLIGANLVEDSAAQPRLSARLLPRDTNVFKAPDGEFIPKKLAVIFGNGNGAQPYPLDAFFALPPGFVIDPAQNSFENMRNCDARPLKSDEPDNPDAVDRHYDPRELIWEKVEAGSPSTGELWRVTTPEGVTVPRDSAFNCEFNVYFNAVGAAEGTYGQPGSTEKLPLDSQFPPVRIMLSSADKTQRLSEPSENTYTDDNYGFSCDGYGTEGADLSSCIAATAKRWAYQDMSFIVPRVGAIFLEKWVHGDKDPEGLWTRFPATEGQPDLSFATRKALFRVDVGAAGSLPLEDYVLYDALPSENPQPITLDEKIDMAKDELVPTLSGPISLPGKVSSYDFDLKKWTKEDIAAEVYYSKSNDPCRPEVNKNRCSSFDENPNEWLSEKDVTNWSEIRYIRVAFKQRLTSKLSIYIPMDMPRQGKVDSIQSGALAINRAAAEAKVTDAASETGSNDPGKLPAGAITSPIAFASKLFSGLIGRTQVAEGSHSLGVKGSRAARVAYVPELRINKSMLIPTQPNGKCDNALDPFDGNLDDTFPYLQQGEEFCFRLAVRTLDLDIFRDEQAPGDEDTKLGNVVIRDYLPPNLEFVGKVSGQGEITERSGYTGGGALVNPKEMPKDSTELIWIPEAGKTTGLIPGDSKPQPNPGDDPEAPKIEDPGTAVEYSVITFKVKVKDDANPSFQSDNYMVGATASLVAEPTCGATTGLLDSGLPSQPKWPESSEEDLGGAKLERKLANQLLCDSQPYLIGAKLSGSVYQTTADATAGSVNQETSKFREQIEVELLDENGDAVLDRAKQPIKTMTEADGSYEFKGIAPGNYQVKFHIPSAIGGKWSFGAKDLFAPNMDTDESPNAGTDELGKLGVDTVKTKIFTVGDPGEFVNVPELDTVVINDTTSPTPDPNPTPLPTPERPLVNTGSNAAQILLLASLLTLIGAGALITRSRRLR